MMMLVHPIVELGTRHAPRSALPPCAPGPCAPVAHADREDAS